MPTILNGTARDPGGGAVIWGIIDANGTAICQFSHLTFSHILHGALVKFIDDDSNPGMAEQVWAATQVEPLVSAAIPANGATNLARERLEAYVMKKLQTDLLNQRSGNPAMSNQLVVRLTQLQSALNAMPQQRATGPRLRLLGI